MYKQFQADATLSIVQNGTNPCINKGCEGACCINNEIHMSAEEFEIYNPNKIPFRKVKDKMEFYRVLNSRDPRTYPDGTYLWEDEEGLFHVANVGRHCWNYVWGQGCAIWKNRPGACTNFDFEGEQCDYARRIEKHLAEF